jgi:ubiquinol-cytochrome c reductase cytochrome c1 subunit
MKRLLLLFILLAPATVFAAGGACGSIPCAQPHNDLSDKASLQRGAVLFVNYCMGCHTAEYARFQRIGNDLGFSESQLKQYLMLSAEKVGEQLTIAMRSADAKKWFGVVPPDLSVVARARGTAWLYTYLTSFYLDETKAVGVNNLVFKDVGMPHVLAEQQGWQKLGHAEAEAGHGGHATPKLEFVTLPKLDPIYQAEVDSKKVTVEQAAKGQYHKTVKDLVNFLEYLGEPAKLVRTDLGWKVILFLFIFLIVAYALKKEYWRDVH